VESNGLIVRNCLIHVIKNFIDAYRRPIFKSSKTFKPVIKL
jgi:hypothetical protein